MKTFMQWLKSEGVNPTDIDSAGKDQDLDNAGVPYESDEIGNMSLVDRERDKIERTYQKKVHDLMYKNIPDDDPNTIDPTKGPQGETKGGTVDQKIKTLLYKKIKDMDSWKEKDDEQREKIAIKTPSAYFMQDNKKLFSPRKDINPASGNADRHGETIDKE